MLRYFRFSSEVPEPVPAREVYGQVEPGQGWPSQCPPIRAASAFGWDVLAAFEMVFRRQDDGTWRLQDPVDLESDWAWSPEALALEGHDVEGRPHPGERDEEASDEAVPLVQRNAWFWEKGQELPHPISDHVYEVIKNQVKVSTYLFLETDPNEVLLITDIPNLFRPYRTLTALVDSDWYPASYPWHCVLELDPASEEIVIPEGEPLCRLIPARRDTYFAREMDDQAFDAFFKRSQDWLALHAKGEPGPMMDIRGQYAHQQMKSRFVVVP